jgi:DNA gyrase inhibitor GyrI
MTSRGYTYERAFERTPAGVIEVKTLPEALTLIVRSGGNYFDRSGELFRRLFRYIKRHDVAMTVPVQGEMQGTGMRFFLGKEDRQRGLMDEEGVQVKEVPERTVASIGVRGGYTEKNFTKARSRLEQWTRDHADYEAVGEAYGIYWNSPFVPWFLKRFEVHIPVRSLSSLQ